MSDDATETKGKNRYPDRFTIDATNLDKVAALLAQLRTSMAGCDATRKDILNWIIEKFPPELSAADIADLSRRFYNEERFLRAALDEIKAAKARGEQRTLEDILQRKSTGAQAALPRKPRKRKAPAGTEIEQASAGPDGPSLGEEGQSIP